MARIQIHMDLYREVGSPDECGRTLGTFLVYIFVSGLFRINLVVPWECESLKEMRDEQKLMEYLG